MLNNSQKSDRPPCPYCGSTDILKNGSTHHKKPKFLCKTCRRQFIENPQKKVITPSEQLTVEKLLKERISLRGIARALEISLSWIQTFVNNLYRSSPLHLSFVANYPEDLEIECDELWSFVNSKENPVYIWLAIARNSRQIVGFYLGDRSRNSAEMFWQTIPDFYRNTSRFYTDLWDSYRTVIPSERHYPSSKKSGQTTRIERLNNTLRQRCSRLVRKSLSFSKSFYNHEGAILYFINDYNQNILLSNSSSLP